MKSDKSSQKRWAAAVERRAAVFPLGAAHLFSVDGSLRSIRAATRAAPVDGVATVHRYRHA